MAQRTLEQKEQMRENLRHPVEWMKGKDLPPEKIHPWEIAVQILPGIFGGLRNTFTNNLGWLWQNVFMMDKIPQTVLSTITGVWDGVNDPLIGAYMDYRNYPSRINRWFCRVNVLVGNLLTLLLVFHLGLTTWQRVLLIVIVRCIQDTTGTAAGVCGSKIYAQITPHSEERSKLVTASALGSMISSNISTGFSLLIGLRDIFHFTPYGMFMWWSVLFTIPAIVTDMLPTFMPQRVPDPPQPTEKFHAKDVLREIKESFLVMRHNKYFVLSTLGSLLSCFTPNIYRGDFYRFSGINDVVEASFKGWSDKGNPELLVAARDFLTGVGGSLMQPFASKVIKKFNGPRNFRLMNTSANVVGNLARYLLGFKTVPRILGGWGVEAVLNMFAKWDGVAGGIIGWEMLDYVEYKTGRRSEGVSTAVNGLVNKIALNNLNTIVGNLALHKVGFDINLGLDQPPLYKKWAAAFYYLMPSIDSGFSFFVNLFYKYPTSERQRVEAELIQRRAAAKAALGETTDSEANSIDDESSL
ncbi:MAG: hypothetical protein LBR73_09870 [Oscillospiraceae bacterium]|jgi:Na+/melibiose symporter-like transporter|nr:hypothetical protein [Oscillospiraceae bacterium]